MRWQRDDRCWKQPWRGKYSGAAGAQELAAQGAGCLGKSTRRTKTRGTSRREQTGSVAKGRGTRGADGYRLCWTLLWAKAGKSRCGQLHVVLWVAKRCRTKAGGDNTSRTEGRGCFWRAYLISRRAATRRAPLQPTSVQVEAAAYCARAKPPGGLYILVTSPRLVCTTDKEHHCSAG